MIINTNKFEGYKRIENNPGVYVSFDYSDLNKIQTLKLGFGFHYLPVREK